MKYETFYDWSEAFDVCRDRDHPIIATVEEPDGEIEGEIAKIYPSGCAKTVGNVNTNRSK